MNAEPVLQFLAKIPRVPCQFVIVESYDSLTVFESNLIYIIVYKMGQSAEKWFKHQIALDLFEI